MSAFAQFPKIYELHGPEFLLTLKEAQELHEKAEALYYQGEYIAAIQQLEDALRITEQSVGGEHRDVINILTTMAEGYLITGNPGKAAELLKRGLQMGEKILGVKHPVVARILRDLATVHFIQGNLSAAESTLDRCFAVQEKHYGTNHVAYALSLQIHALILLSAGKTSEAAAPVKYSSEIIEKVLGQDNYQYGMSLYLQSVIALHQANFAKAIELCERSRSLFEKRVGQGHIMLTLVNNNLAALYQQVGKYEQALSLLEQNLALLERTLGQDNLQVAMALNSLGMVYYSSGDYSAAERLLQRGLTLRERYIGRENPGYAATVNNLALVLMELGKDSEVPRLFRNAASTLEKTFGTESPELATVLSNWGVDSENHRLLDMAKQFYQESLVIRDKAFGRNHPSVAESLNLLGSLYLKLGDIDKALIGINRSLEIRLEFYGKNHPAVAISLDSLAEICVAKGEDIKAMKLLAQSIFIKGENFGVDHPSVASTLERLALISLNQGDLSDSIRGFSMLFASQRSYLERQFSKIHSNDALEMGAKTFYRTEILHSICASAASDNFASASAAEQLALNKSVLEEVQATQSAFDTDPKSGTQVLREQYHTVQTQLEHLPEAMLDPVQRDTQRREWQSELSDIEAKLAERVGMVAQTIRERNLTLADIARNLPSQSVLVDLIQYQRYDFTVKTNRWKEARYTAYLTFPLAKDSTNIVVERVDLGEAAPINEAVELICRRMGAGQFRAKDLSATLQRLSELVYAPLVKHLTNVSHLIVCPDGQLSRVPFEMLPLPPFGPRTRYLVEEKTISYVTSGREIVPIATPKSKVQSSKSLVMGNPDFDLDLPRSRRREEAEASRSEGASQVEGVRLLTSAATRSLSRSYRGIKFTPLLGSEEEAKSVAQLLGGDCALRLGKDAREAELKAVVSPRVLHLATHGFFLTDQEFKRTNAMSDLMLAGTFGAGTIRSRRREEADSVTNSQGPPPYVGGYSASENDWENPMVRCGVALAGANHATSITNALAEDGLLTGLEASLLNLQGTELVILSACESGSGEVKIGEGVMSLRRAFRIAGAETVLASHWKVSDKATSQLMTDFLRRWRRGAPRAQAWHQAQLALLRSKEFANPYYWAAFTLTGQWQ